MEHRGFSNAIDSSCNEVGIDQQVLDVARDARNAIICINKLKHVAKGMSEAGKARIPMTYKFFQTSLLLPKTLPAQPPNC